MNTSRDVTIRHVYDITLLVLVFLKCEMNGQTEKDEYVVHKTTWKFLDGIDQLISREAWRCGTQNYTKISWWHRSADRSVYLKAPFVIVLIVLNVNSSGLLNIERLNWAKLPIQRYICHPIDLEIIQISKLI